MLRDLLWLRSIEVGRRLYRKPNTSKKHPAHPVFPYALRGLAIEQAN
jgi:putative transposase